MSNNIQKAKKALRQNVLHIKTYDEVDALFFYCPIGVYIIFDSISLKNYFLNNTNQTIINCNSSYERFLMEMENYDEKSIFVNVNFCSDFSILELIDKTNNTIID